MPIFNEVYILTIINKCRRNEASQREWEKLYEYCQPRIYLFLKIVGLEMRFSLAELEDATQDVFIKLIEKFPNIEFNLLKKFNQYLDVMCKHYLIDLVRGSKRGKILIPLENLERILTDPDQLLHDESYEKVEFLTLLQEEVNKLPHYCQNILNPILKDNLTLSEISKLYNIPEGSIYTQYKRCVEKLKNKLKEM